MAHFAKTWPLGLTDGVTTLPHDQLEDIDTKTYKAVNGDDGGTWNPSLSAIVVGGAGMSRSFKASTWDDFAADAGGKRTQVRRFLWTPVSRMFPGGSAIQYGFVQGGGIGLACSTPLPLTIPDNATLTELRAYVLVKPGRLGGPPLVFPRLQVQRYSLSGSPPAPGELLSAVTAAFPMPASLDAYEAATAQSWAYVPDQNNVLDRATYHYVAHLYDEEQGGAISGNIFYGLQATFTMTDWRP